MKDSNNPNPFTPDKIVDRDKAVPEAIQKLEEAIAALRSGEVVNLLYVFEKDGDPCFSIAGNDVETLTALAYHLFVRVVVSQDITHEEIQALLVRKAAQSVLRKAAH